MRPSPAMSAAARVRRRAAVPFLAAVVSTLSGAALVPAAAAAETSGLGPVPSHRPDDGRSVQLQAGAVRAGAGGSTSFTCPVSVGLSSSCRLVRVPVRHADPGGPAISVAAVRFSATTVASTVVPLVFLTGGPGGSGIADLSSVPELAQALAQGRDVITIDPRGTGLSLPRLECGPVDSGGPQRVDIARGCVARLRGAGVDVRAFNTTESAADVAAVLDVFGVAKADLLGVSYGTRLAMTVARDHPTRVRRMVLDGTYPPGASLFDQPNRSGARAIRRLVADRPGVAQRFTELVRRLDLRPARDGQGGRISGADLATTVYDQLYTNRTEPERLERLVTRAADGDVRGLAALISDDPAPTSTSSSVGAYWAAQCQEDAPFVTPKQMADSGTGDPLAAALLRGFRSDYDACRAWHLPGDLRARIPVRSSVPTLLLAGDLDPVTPPRRAFQAAATLPAAQVVRFPRAGHVVLAYPTCAVDLVGRFLASRSGRVAAGCATAR